MILITADHETGGLSVSTEAEYPNPYAGKGKTIYYQYTTGNHTKTDVDLFVYGIEPDFSEFAFYSSDDRIKNIDVYNLASAVLEDPTKYAK